MDSPAHGPGTGSGLPRCLWLRGLVAAALRDFILCWFDTKALGYLLFCDFIKASGINFQFVLHLKRDDSPALEDKGIMEVFFVCLLLSAEHFLSGG